MALAASLTLAEGIDKKVIIAPSVTLVEPYYVDGGIGDQTFVYYTMVPGRTYELRQGDEVYRFTWEAGGWDILLLIQHADQEPITLWEVSKLAQLRH